MFAYVGFFLYLCAINAAAAQWWPLNALPKLAFDHDKILADAVQALKING